MAEGNITVKFDTEGVGEVKNSIEEIKGSAREMSEHFGASGERSRTISEETQNSSESVSELSKDSAHAANSMNELSSSAEKSAASLKSAANSVRDLKSSSAGNGSSGAQGELAKAKNDVESFGKNVAKTTKSSFATVNKETKNGFRKMVDAAGDFGTKMSREASRLMQAIGSVFVVGQVFQAGYSFGKGTLSFYSKAKDFLGDLTKGGFWYATKNTLEKDSKQGHDQTNELDKYELEQIKTADEAKQKIDQYRDALERLRIERDKNPDVEKAAYDEYGYQERRLQRLIRRLENKEKELRPSELGSIAKSFLKDADKKKAELEALEEWRRNYEKAGLGDRVEMAEKRVNELEKKRAELEKEISNAGSFKSEEALNEKIREMEMVARQLNEAKELLTSATDENDAEKNDLNDFAEKQRENLMKRINDSEWKRAYDNADAQKRVEMAEKKAAELFKQKQDAESALKNIPAYLSKDEIDELKSSLAAANNDYVQATELVKNAQQDAAKKRAEEMNSLSYQSSGNSLARVGLMRSSPQINLIAQATKSTAESAKEAVVQLEKIATNSGNGKVVAIAG